jgi:membrane protease YdiL (CAAX protease family)
LQGFTVTGLQFLTFQLCDINPRKVLLNITLNHFSAALVFAIFASIVFGITHRDNTRDMVRYGLYCFAMFIGGVFVAGWVMWLLRR